MGEVLHRFSDSFMSRVTFPKDKVLGLVVEDALVEDFLNFILGVWRIDFNQRRWYLFSVLKGVLVVVLQKGYVKYWVDLHILRKVKSISCLRYYCSNLEGSNELQLKLLEGSPCIY